MSSLERDVVQILEGLVTLGTIFVVVRIISRAWPGGKPRERGYGR